MLTEEHPFSFNVFIYRPEFFFFFFFFLPLSSIHFLFLFLFYFFLLLLSCLSFFLLPFLFFIFSRTRSRRLFDSREPFVLTRSEKLANERDKTLRANFIRSLRRKEINMVDTRNVYLYSMFLIDLFFLFFFFVFLL